MSPRERETPTQTQGTADDELLADERFMTDYEYRAADEGSGL